MVELDTLITVLNEYLEGKAPIEKIEQATTPFIVNDESMLKDEELSRIIYILDMQDLENLERQDIVRLRDELLAFQKKETRH